MERSSYSPEHQAELENIEFYMRWIKDTFNHETMKSDFIHQFHEKLAALDLTMDSQAYVDFYDIDLGGFIAERDALAERLAKRIEEQLEETANDLQQNIFDTKLFDVYVYIRGGEKHRVEGVIVSHGHVVPVIEGVPYAARPVEGVAFYSCSLLELRHLVSDTIEDIRK